MNVKELRNQLERWGLYWSKQRSGSGYASTSMTGQACKILRTGVYSQGTNRMTDLDFDIPDWVQEIDAVVSELSANQRSDLKYKYFNRKYKFKSQALYQAEVYLCGVL